MAARVEFEDDNGRVVRYVRHANGGGLVSPEARVHEGAMVASTAYVEAGAQVGDRSRIGAGSWLDLDVIVAEDVVVTGNVHLGPSSCVPHGFDNESRTHRHPSRPGPDLLCGGGSALHPVLGVPLARTLDQAAMRTAMRKGQAVCGWIGRPGPVATSRHSHSSTVSLPS